eukprot:CAMPEP_0194448186 /NCGR_PEP_ID=MMETSP0176-20130528/129429_1 /TAXON_ID=216777 /ORGANISM="Proboscia alata, Strain PI-D3" /LENGTH=846 /DNA_ID=CAMNT_0039275131 /DNA_START=197 /DNA_END=2734 /DNA_ORIENTATION=+
MSIPLSPSSGMVERGASAPLGTIASAAGIAPAAVPPDMKSKSPPAALSPTVTNNPVPPPKFPPSILPRNVSHEKKEKHTKDFTQGQFIMPSNYNQHAIKQQLPPKKQHLQQSPQQPSSLTKCAPLKKITTIKPIHSIIEENQKLHERQQKAAVAVAASSLSSMARIMKAPLLSATGAAASASAAAALLSTREKTNSINQARPSQGQPLQPNMLKLQPDKQQAHQQLKYHHQQPMSTKSPSKLVVTAMSHPQSSTATVASSSFPIAPMGLVSSSMQRSSSIPLKKRMRIRAAQVATNTSIASIQPLIPFDGGPSSALHHQLMPRGTSSPPVPPPPLNNNNTSSNSNSGSSYFSNCNINTLLSVASSNAAMISAAAAAAAAAAVAAAPISSSNAISTMTTSSPAAVAFNINGSSKDSLTNISRKDQISNATNTSPIPTSSNSTIDKNALHLAAVAAAMAGSNSNNNNRSTNNSYCSTTSTAICTGSSVSSRSSRSSSSSIDFTSSTRPFSCITTSISHSSEDPQPLPGGCHQRTTRRRRRKVKPSNNNKNTTGGEEYTYSYYCRRPRYGNELYCKIHYMQRLNEEGGDAVAAPSSCLSSTSLAVGASHQVPLVTNAIGSASGSGGDFTKAVAGSSSSVSVTSSNSQAGGGNTAIGAIELHHTTHARSNHSLSSTNISTALVAGGVMTSTSLNSPHYTTAGAVDRRYIPPSSPGMASSSDDVQCQAITTRGRPCSYVATSVIVPSTTATATAKTTNNTSGWGQPPMSVIGSSTSIEHQQQILQHVVLPINSPEGRRALALQQQQQTTGIDKKKKSSFCAAPTIVCCHLHTGQYGKKTGRRNKSLVNVAA